ncbi:hypothetical protein F5Y16DRAFT_370968 [Xylariaceae sp. FL0255]|nr:hypothetical protein F5Y16DRAFT_370968 [Xylariaceae sp. FL0255]
MKSLWTVSLATLYFLRQGTALQVTSGSACAALCIASTGEASSNSNSSPTNITDITCTDDSFDSSTNGIRFKNCVDCLQKSNATSSTENDVSAFLYNIRYSLDVCLFGYPGNATQTVSSPCDINYACQPLQTAMEADSLDPTANQYDYCSAGSNAFNGSHVDTCIQCLASSNNQAYFSNFMTALKAGCEQKPAAGTLLGLSGTLFTSSAVNITDPPVTSSSGGDDNFTILTTGAIVGIAVGGGLLLIGGIALFWVYHRRQKLLYSGYSINVHDPNAPNTPPRKGGLPITNKNLSPPMSDYELRAQRGYTNNSDYYDMLEKEIQSKRANYAVDPNHPLSGPDSVLPTHHAYLPRTHSRHSSRNTTPEPPRFVKTNKPDSYTLQTYLSSIENAASLLPPPPSQPPPNMTSRDSSPLRGSSLSRHFSHSRDSSFGSRGPSPDRRPLISSAQPTTTASLNTIPPPPRQEPKVPSIQLPSVPRIRIPKKYTPPKITIEGPTPIDGPLELNPAAQQADTSIGLDISKPLASHEARFSESQWERRRKAPSAPLAVQQMAVDRRPKPWVMSDNEVKSAKSDFYG